MSSVGAEGYGEHTSGVSNGPSTALTPIDALGSIDGECLHTLDSVWRHLPVDASQRVNISRNDARTIGAECNGPHKICASGERQAVGSRHLPDLHCRRTCGHNMSSVGAEGYGELVVGVEVIAVIL